MKEIFTKFRAKTIIFGLVFVFALVSQSAVFAQKTGERQYDAPPPKAEAKTTAKVSPVDDAKIKDLLRPNGKPLLVNFWATWCVPCREEFPDLVKIDAEYRGKIDFFTVSLDFVEEINRDVPKFLNEMKAEMPAYLLVSEDESALIAAIAKDWSGGLPFTILYNEKGEMVYFKQGKIDPEILKNMLTGLLKTKQ